MIVSALERKQSKGPGDGLEVQECPKALLLYKYSEKFI